MKLALQPLTQRMARLAPKKISGARLGMAALALSLTLASAAAPQPAYAAGGTVVAWGNNTYGQTNVSAGLSDAIAVAAGIYHSLALKSDGTVVAWGDNVSGQATVPAGLSGVTAVAAGRFHNLALKGDGTVVAWGNNTSGQATVPAGLSGVTAVAAGGLHSLALKGDDTVVAWGNNDEGQATVPAGLSGVTAVAAGRAHNLVVKSDGTVVAWGYNNYGQTNVPAGLSGVIAVAAGEFHSLALKGDGTVVAWGNNGFGQATVPAGLSGVTAVAAGGLHSLALKGDGTVVAWGINTYGQTNVPAGLSGVIAVAAGGEHSLAIGMLAPTDTTPPVITPNVVGTLGNNGWYRSDVTVSWAVSDAESSITSQTGCDPVTINADTAATTLTCSAASAGGTSTQSVTIKRDATAPTISGSPSPAPNAAGWNNTDVTVSFSCNDALSGIASCGPNQTLSSHGASLSASGTASDQAGNSATATVSGINIDKTAPTLTPAVSPNPVLLNGAATVTSGAADALSGLASQSCGALDTTSAGSKSVTCTATDIAGNTASANASYAVIYNFAGFFQPVDNLPTVNQVKAGSAVPVKFSLGGNQGLSILAANSPASQQIACDTTAPTAPVEETVTAGNSSLQYDPATNQYTYVWKTDKAWANMCRQLVVTLVDGTQHRANFMFK